MYTSFFFTFSIAISIPLLYHILRITAPNTSLLSLLTLILHRKMITGIAHVNLTVPPGTLEQAAAFYEGTLGFKRVAVPVLQRETLAW